MSERINADYRVTSCKFHVQSKSVFTVYFDNGLGLDRDPYDQNSILNRRLFGHMWMVFEPPKRLKAHDIKLVTFDLIILYSVHLRKKGLGVVNKAIRSQ